MKTVRATSKVLKSPARQSHYRIWGFSKLRFTQRLAVTLVVAWLGVHGVVSEAVFAESRTETVSFHSPALEANPAADPATRNATVYLPESYDESNRDFPVVYMLHGTGGNERSFRNLKSVADAAVRSGKMDEFILVVADGSSRYAASFYENSPLNGNHRDYIADDLVRYIDENYRTLAQRQSRGIMGHSTGGYGALLFGMKESDVFGAAYSLSGGGMCFSQPICATYLGSDTAVFSSGFEEAFGDPRILLNGIDSPDDVVGLFQREMYSMASAFSPNLNNAPLFVDLPWTGPELTIVPKVRDRWFEHDVFVMLPNHLSQLQSLRGLAFDVGDQDEFGLALESIALHEALTDSHVDHQFGLFSGGHNDKLSQRLPVAFEFFSDRLVTFLPTDCDFNANGSCGPDDVADDTLFRVNLEIGSAGTEDLESFDLTSDGIVDRRDLEHWLTLAALENGFDQPFVPGDANLDGAVDFADFLSLARNFLSDDRDWSQAEFTGDMQVGFADFLALSANFGTEISRITVETVAVPENASPIPFVLGMAMLICQRRRRRRTWPRN